MPIENLRFGFDLETSQLLFEARHRARQLRQIEVDRVHLLVEASRKMLTSPALLSMVSSRSASTRAISTRSAGALSRPATPERC